MESINHDNQVWGEKKTSNIQPTSPQKQKTSHTPHLRSSPYKYAWVVETAWDLCLTTHKCFTNDWLNTFIGVLIQASGPRWNQSRYGKGAHLSSPSKKNGGNKNAKHVSKKWLQVGAWLDLWRNELFRRTWFQSEKKKVSQKVVDKFEKSTFAGVLEVQGSENRI